MVLSSVDNQIHSLRQFDDKKKWLGFKLND